MSTRELKHDLESRMIRIAISVTTFLALLVAPAAAQQGQTELQGQTDAMHDAALATAALDLQLDALNKKLAEILARPLPTTEELLSSTLYGTVDRRTNFPRGINLPPEWLMRSRTARGAALGPGDVRAQATDEAPARDAVAELVVENNQWFDVHLYLVRGGLRTSLGFLTSLGRREFELPSIATTQGVDVRIFVYPIAGGRPYLTPPLIVNPGDVWKLVVENNPALSRVWALPTA